MKYARLGNSELTVSRICLGCMGFGDAQNGQHTWTLDYEKSLEIMKAAYERGINFFDTAAAYQNGTGEEYVGKALKTIAKREDFMLATKFMPRSAEQRLQLSAGEHIETSLADSLRRLGTDYIDLYIMHMWDADSDLHDIMATLNAAVRSGKVRALGLANSFAWQLAEANALAERENLTPFVAVQNHHNLIYREDEREMSAYCALKNIALTPYSALAGGRLSRRAGETSRRFVEDQYAKFKYDGMAAEDGIIIQRVEEVAGQRGVSMSEIALAWLMTQTTAPIAGATKPHHVDIAAKSVDLVLHDDEIRYLEECYRPHPLSGLMAKGGRAKAVRAE